MIYTHAHLPGSDLELRADVVVIGSGAGGAPVAAELASRGKRVVVLEAGSYWLPRDFTQVEYEMFPRLYADKAGRTTQDRGIHVHQGRGVGGSTLHNLSLCARVPDAVLAAWRNEHGWKHLPERVLDALYAEVEQRLPVTRIDPGRLNGNNQVFRRGCEALGYRGGMLSHNRDGCVGSGFCELGCAYDAKQHALKRYLVAAVEDGADVLADTRALRVEWRGRRATRVHAEVRDPASGRRLAKVAIEARAVCVSASATGTPSLLEHSAVPDPRRLIGSRLFLHPGAAVAARFQEALHSWRGIPQSYECTEFLQHTADASQRVWLVPSFAHPAGVASMLSAFGEEHQRYLGDYAHLAAASAMVHDHHPGRVLAGADGRPQIHYELHPNDAEQLRLGLREATRILLAAGAEAAFLPLAKTVRIGSVDELTQVFERLRIRRQDLELSAVHPMGSVWMGDDPLRACVDSTGRYHHLDNLFVADTSLYPSSIGVPPQLTAYALGTHVGRQIAEHLG
ncbi:MAG TPA: GMC family oxidoreductase [Polyangiaceae bacterium]|nr:GMC family oxidoreductase [Polyangiaceae bacterium]